MDSENDGAIWRTFFLSICALAIVAGVAACGAPVINSSGLSWDNSIWTNAQNQRTERERLRLAAETRQAIEREETARIMSDNMMTTIQWLAVTGGIVGGLAVAGWATQRSVAAWAARPHRPVATNVNLRITYEQARRLAQPHLLALPGSRLEWVDGDGWSVVSDELQIVKPLLLEDRQRNV